MCSCVRPSSETELQHQQYSLLVVVWSLESGKITASQAAHRGVPVEWDEYEGISPNTASRLGQMHVRKVGSGSEVGSG